MALYTKTMEDLIAGLNKLPGVGPKTAERLAFFILSSPPDYSRKLSEAIAKLKEQVSWCRVCFNLAESDKCRICSNASRDHTIICVVEKPKDIIPIEKSHSFQGTYHVLLGALSPLDGIEPDDLKIKELVNRIKKEKTKEIILATGANTEGEMTALYITRLLKPLKVRLSRIAYGIPVGANLEYADSVTLGRAIDGRRNIT